MSVTLSTLRQRMSRMMGDYISATATDDGNVGGTTVISTDLKALTLTNDTYKNWWALVTSGTYSGQERLISDFTQSTGTVTVDTAFGGKIVDNVTFEIHRYQPSLKKQFINYAMHSAFPYFNKLWDDRTLVAGNYLLNSNFELWASSSVPDSWAKGGAPTVAAQAVSLNKVRNGAYSCLFTTVDYANDYLYQSQNENIKLLDLADSDANVYGFARTLSGTNGLYVKITSYDDTGTATTSTSSTVSLTNDWIKVSAENLAICDDASRVEVRIQLTGNGTVFLDNFVLFGNRDVYEYLLPTGLKYVTSAYYGNDWEDAEYHDQARLLDFTLSELGANSYIRFYRLPPKELKLRLLGFGYETDLSADTDSWQLDDKRADIVASKAAGLMFESLASTSAVSNVERYLSEASKRDLIFQQAIRNNQMVPSSIQTSISDDGGYV